MRLIDLDAEKDYLLDGRYAIKAPLVAHFEVIGSKFMRKKFNPVCCSLCKKRLYEHFNYCPNCGAKMDGDENG